MKLGSGAHSLIGKNHRLNEDRFRLLTDQVPMVSAAGRGQIFGVFDGMGSLPRGGEAAQVMCDRLGEFFVASGLPPGAASLVNLLYSANIEIRVWGDNTGGKREGGGCAGTVAWFHHERLTIFQAGDTMAIRLREGKAELLTSDHSVDHGLLRYFGMGEPLEIETRELPVEEGDVLILASDGVIKGAAGLNVAEIAACVGREYLRNIDNALEYAAREVCRLAVQRGSVDDISTVVIEVEDLDDEP